MARRGHSCAAHGSVGAALLGAVGFKPSKYDFYPQNDREGRAISAQNAGNEQQLPVKTCGLKPGGFQASGEVLRSGRVGMKCSSGQQPAQKARRRELKLLIPHPGDPQFHVDVCYFWTPQNSALNPSWFLFVPFLLLGWWQSCP